MSKLLLITAFVVCMGVCVTSEDQYRVLFSMGPKSSLPTAWFSPVQYLPAIIGGNSAGETFEDGEDFGVPVTGDVGNGPVGDTFGANNTEACCSTGFVDTTDGTLDGGDDGTLVIIVTNPNNVTTGGNITVTINDVPYTFPRNVTGIYKIKKNDNKVLIIALSVVLGSCAILGGAAIYIYYQNKKHGSSRLATKNPQSSSLPAQVQRPGSTKRVAQNESQEMTNQQSGAAQSSPERPRTGTNTSAPSAEELQERIEAENAAKNRPIGNKVATYLWNAAANAVADPPPGGDVPHLPNVVEAVMD